MVYLGVIDGELDYVPRPRDGCPFRLRRSVKWYGALTPAELGELAGGVARVGGIQTVSRIEAGAPAIIKYIDKIRRQPGNAVRVMRNKKPGLPPARIRSGGSWRNFVPLSGSGKPRRSASKTSRTFASGGTSRPMRRGTRSKAGGAPRLGSS